MRLLSQFDREKIEAFAEVSIGLLDLIDGDAALEAEPDDEDDDPAGQCDEDGMNTALASVTVWSGLGCPISDPDESRENWLP